jgi:hypothetical protein
MAGGGGGLPLTAACVISVCGQRGGMWQLYSNHCTRCASVCYTWGRFGVGSCIQPCGQVPVGKPERADVRGYYVS